MKRHRRNLVLTIALVAALSLILAGDAARPKRTTAQTCQYPCLAFFDQMSVAHSNNALTTRTQGLDPTIWGSSRVNQQSNVGQGQYDVFQPSTLTTCPGSPTVLPDADENVCGGAFAESMSVGAGDIFALTAVYPKQPMDWAGRTGTITTAVDLIAEGGHGNWPVVALTDQPVPAPQPYNGLDTPSEYSTPRNGVFVSFAADCGGIWM